jgi:hypothetical protein
VLYIIYYTRFLKYQLLNNNKKKKKKKKKNQVPVL